MANVVPGAALEQIRHLFAAGTVAGLSDAQLLDRFRAGRDTSAFEALVTRHGPMVLAVCRGVLRDPHDAEDAFQATFLVLVRKAGTIRGCDALGGWLHKVAHRVAREANAASARRHAHEREAGRMAAASSSSGSATRDERLSALHEEIARLPEKHRLPVVLCELEGIPQAQAAWQLRWSERTLRRRLAEGRERLRSRMDRRGLGTAGAMIGTLLASEAKAAVSAAWRETTIRAALAVALQAATTGVVSVAAGKLTHEVLKTMLLQKIKLASAALLGAGLLAWEVSAALSPRGDEPPETREARASAPVSTPIKKDETMGRIDVGGRVLDPDGKPVPGATIYFRESRSYRVGEEAGLVQRVASTGPDGRFRFDLDPARNDVALFAGDSEPGDGPAWHTTLIAATAPHHGPAWLTAGQNKRGETDLRLVQDDLPIRGRILDSQGRPVAGAAVRVDQIAATSGVDLEALIASGVIDWDRFLVGSKFQAPVLHFPVWIGREGAVTTDVGGRFEITGVGRDRLALLTVVGPGLERARVAVLDRTARSPARPRPRPSRPDMLNQATELPLYGSAFEHVVGPSRPVTGVISAKGTGLPVAGVTVAGQIMGRPWSVVMTTTDARGRYRLDGLPKSDSYHIDVRPGPGIPHLAARSIVTDTAGVQPLDAPLELPRGVAVKGRVINKQTGRVVRCEQVMYQPLPSNPRQDAVHFFKSDPDDAFRITVPPGAGMIVAKVAGTSHPYAPARLAPADKGKGIDESVDLRRVGEGFPLALYHAYRFVDVPEGADPALVVLEVSPGIALRGELVGADGRPVGGAKAYGLTNDLFRSRTIEGAAFTVLGLPPGGSRRVEFRHEDLGLAGSAIVTASSPPDRPLVVKLSPFASLKGRILDEDGQPLRGAKVGATVHGRGPYVPSDPIFQAMGGPTDHEGRFLIKGINPTLGVSVRVEDPNHPAPKYESKLDKDLGNVSTRPGEVSDLGDIRIRPNQVF